MRDVKNWVAVPGKRLQVTARANNIDFVEDGFWGGTKMFPRFVVTGIRVPRDKVKLLKSAIEARDKRRLTIGQREARKARRQEKEKREFLRQIKEEFPGMPDSHARACAEHTTEIGSGRVGRSRQVDNPVECAVTAYVRHNCTEYEDLLKSLTREMARDLVHQSVQEFLKSWRKNENE